MNWGLGFSASYHACYVDPVTWKDLARIDLTAGTVNRTGTGLRQSASVGCIEYDKESERWIRIYMDTRQPGDTSRIALFTGLTSVPEESIDSSLAEATVECYSVLKPAQDVLLDIGWYAAEGFKGAEVVKGLLSVGPAPVDIKGESPRLSEDIIAERDESNLSMADKILEAIGWRLMIAGDGRITICPQAGDVSAVFDALTYDLILPPVSRKNNWFECPNVVRVISDTDSYTAYDDDPGSNLSTKKRGREIWKEEDSVVLSDAESLAEYARRKLKELQAVSDSISYSRSFHPDAFPTDRIRVHYPAQNMNGIFVVKSQTISLDACGTTSEEANAI